jgi:hypothetical protein
MCTNVVVALLNYLWYYYQILGVSLQNLTQLDGCTDVLNPFIWSCVIGLMSFRDGSDKRTASHFVQTSGKVRRRLWQWLDKHLRKKHEPYTKSSNSPRPKGGIGEEQRLEHDDNFLWYQADCSQGILPGRPNSQFRILLWLFMATGWKRAKISPRILDTKELAVVSL